MAVDPNAPEGEWRDRVLGRDGKPLPISPPLPAPEDWPDPDPDPPAPAREGPEHPSE